MTPLMPGFVGFVPEDFAQRNPGANVVDQEVARDGNLVTSRSPDDLPAFCTAIVELFAQAGQSTVGAGGRS